MQICMDWRSVKFDWNRARAFLVTAEEGSLSAAARALGMAQPTLGRQVDALEDELGVVLFERAGRGLVLTPSGLELLDHVRSMGEAAGRMSLAASGHSQSIEGSIAITASELGAAHLLPPIVQRIRREHPGITIEIVASNQTVDLRRRESDIALRSVEPTQPELIARRVRDDPVRLYGTPAYLDSIGNPGTLEALAERADFVAFDTTSRFIEMLNGMGVPVTGRNFPIVSASLPVHWEMVKTGVAIGIIPGVIGDREPGVVPVLPDLLPPIIFPTWLVTHRELNTSRRVRVVFDILAEELAKL